jgi:hypothetical protein
VGAAVSLPLLDAMVPAAMGAQAAAVKAPVRALFYIVGGGAYLPNWTLDDSGRRQELSPERAVGYQAKPSRKNEALGELSPTLAPLAGFKDDLLVLGGLTLVNSHQFEDGHSAEIAGLLTAAPLARDRVQCGVSIDQLAAKKLAGQTYLDSLVIGLNGNRPGGAKGVGRVYAQHYSWRSPTTPTGEDRSPRAVFDRLFGNRDKAGGSGAAALSADDRQSVLDLVLEEAKRLNNTLGQSDRQKMDEYLTAVRDVERRIAAAAKRPAAPDAPSLQGDPRFPFEVKVAAGTGIPEKYEDYDALMVDLVALAFATDTTRVAVLTHGGYRAYPEVDVKRGHHDLQHHEGDAAKRADLCKVDQFNMGLFAKTLARFKSTPDAGGTLLDNSMVMWGSGMSNGNRHARENLPILLAGKAGGTIKTGRHVAYDWTKRTPLANLYLEMLDRLGAPAEKFGDSTGRLPDLT